MPLNEDTSGCSSTGSAAWGMRSFSERADTVAATWVTSRSGRRPLRATSQPRPALSSAQTASAIHSQRSRAAKKSAWWVTSSASSRVSDCPGSASATSAVIPRSRRLSSHHSHSPRGWVRKRAGIAACAGSANKTRPSRSTTCARRSWCAPSRVCNCGCSAGNSSARRRLPSRRWLACSLSCRAWRSRSMKCSRLSRLKVKPTASSTPVSASMNSRLRRVVSDRRRITRGHPAGSPCRARSGSAWVRNRRRSWRAGGGSPPR